MKRTAALFAIVLSVAVCLAQTKLNTITNSTGSFVLKFRDFSLTNPTGPVTRLVLENPGGQVYAASKKQGIEMYAPHVTIDAVSTKGKEADSIRDATASGGIRVIRTAESGHSEMTGASGAYTANGKTAKLVVKGPVKVTDTSGTGQSFAASGELLTAEFDDSVSKQPLTTAVLSGAVHMTIRQASRPGQPAADVRASASKLVLHQSSQPPTMVLSGGVSVHGIGSVGSTTMSLEEVVLTLNDRDEVIGMTGSGGPR